MIVYVYNMNRVNLMTRFRYFRKKKSNVFYWVREYSGFYKDNVINFPTSAEYVDLRAKAQSKLNNYFENASVKYKIDKVLIDYVKKTISPGFIDYFIYRVQVDRIKDENSIVIYDNQYEKIFDNDYDNSRINNIIELFSSFIRFLAYSFKAMLISIFFRDKFKIEDVVYVRKQEKPEVFFKFDEFDSVLSKSQQKMSRVFPMVRSKKNQYGFNYINSFQGSFLIWCRAFIFTISYGLNDLLKLHQSKLLPHLNGKFMQHVFLMSMLIEMNAKIYFGMLADKAIYNLLFKYKKDFQRVVMYLDGVNFDGNIVTLDLFHADKCLLSDPFAASGVNQNGGSYNTSDLVGSFVTSSDSAPGNISNDLNDLLPKYKSVVLVASSQIYGNRISYSYQDDQYLPNFLFKFKTISEKHPEVLFILKEKKGEFNYFNLDIFSENVFIIRTKDPKEMKENHFDHVLLVSDIVISLATNSSVILQATKNLKLPIIYNQYHQKTLWKKYGNIEICLKSFESVVDYWINNLSSSIDLIEEINKDFMLSKNFYKESAIKVSSMLE
jgi:hypothetical protein